MRVAILTEYIGSAFHGFQRQDNALTVQSVIEDTYEKVLHEKIRLTSSSRTDTDVSARAHVSCFDTEVKIPAAKLPFVLNRFLPKSLVIKQARRVPADFNPRFAAKGKTYSYSYKLSPQRSALEADLSYHVPQKLDLAAMSAAAGKISGTHDFTALHDVGTPCKSAVRTVYELRFVEVPESQILRFYITGDGFLYHMVRVIAGTLLYAGMHKLSPEEIAQNLKACNRKNMGPTLPGTGLVLEKVYYEQELFGDDAWLQKP